MALLDISFLSLRRYLIPLFAIYYFLGKKLALLDISYMSLRRYLIPLFVIYYFWGKYLHCLTYLIWHWGGISFLCLLFTTSGGNTGTPWHILFVTEEVSHSSVCYLLLLGKNWHCLTYLICHWGGISFLGLLFITFGGNTALLDISYLSLRRYLIPRFVIYYFCWKYWHCLTYLICHWGGISFLCLLFITSWGNTGTAWHILFVTEEVSHSSYLLLLGKRLALLDISYLSLRRYLIPLFVIYYFRGKYWYSLTYLICHWGGISFLGLLFITSVGNTGTAWHILFVTEEVSHSSVCYLLLLGEILRLLDISYLSLRRHLIPRFVIYYFWGKYWHCLTYLIWHWGGISFLCLLFITSGGNTGTPWHILFVPEEVSHSSVCYLLLLGEILALLDISYLSLRRHLIPRFVIYYFWGKYWHCLTYLICHWGGISFLCLLFITSWEKNWHCLTYRICHWGGISFLCLLFITSVGNTGTAWHILFAIEEVSHSSYLLLLGEILALLDISYLSLRRYLIPRFVIYYFCWKYWHCLTYLICHWGGISFLCLLFITSWGNTETAWHILFDTEEVSHSSVCYLLLLLEILALLDISYLTLRRYLIPLIYYFWGKYWHCLTYLICHWGGISFLCLLFITFGGNTALLDISYLTLRRYLIPLFVIYYFRGKYWYSLTYLICPWGGISFLCLLFITSRENWHCLTYLICHWGGISFLGLLFITSGGKTGIAWHLICHRGGISFHSHCQKRVK